MIRQTIIKTGLIVALFATTKMFQACGNAGETNTTDIQAIASGSTTNKLTWPAIERKYQGSADTNGLSCCFWMLNRPVNPGQQPPVCVVYVNNGTTNTFNNYWKTSPSYYLKIELLDSFGKPVGKTTIGKKYEASISEGQLEILYRSKRSWRLTRVEPSDTQFASVSIPELFELKEAGEYTLQVKMRLIQAWPEFKTTWLPEATAKIQVRAGDATK